MTFSLFGGGALETELNLTMKSAVVGVIITSVTDGWDGGSKKKCDNEGKRGENKTGEYFPAYSYYPLQLTASAL